MPELVIISAAARTGVIGDGEAIPWDYPEDHRQYIDRVQDHPVILGRRTFDQMSRIDRTEQIVMTRDPPATEPPHTTYVSSIRAAVDTATEYGDRAFVIGGQSIYALFVPHADRALISEIPETAPGSRVFPYLGSDWEQTDTTAYDTFTLVEYVQPEPAPISSAVQ